MLNYKKDDEYVPIQCLSSLRGNMVLSGRGLNEYRIVYTDTNVSL